MLGGVLVMVGYFTVMEGLWGFTLGKALCRLRVVGRDHSPPGLLRALGRALIYVLVPPLPYWVAFLGDAKAYLNQPQSVQFLMSCTYLVALLLLLCTARRRNGFAAIQDLVTRTRVITRVALQSRPALAVSETPPAALEGQRTVGPYHVLETLQETAEAEWLLGYDLRLLRKVWIRRVAPGTPGLPPALRSIGRVGRLRWITGRRSPEDNWDAFEAATGKPLLGLVQIPQPWSQVRFWLYDLANEISAAEKDGTLPEVLALDRVWITADGRAKLLDFPAPGIARPEAAASSGESRAANVPPSRDARRFLNEVATAALTGQAYVADQPCPEIRARLPLHAGRFLKSLPSLPDANAIAGALQPLLQRMAEVSRLRRAAIVAGCLAFPLVATCSMFFGISMLERWNARNPGLMELNLLLAQRDGMNSRRARKQPRPTDQQFAVYIAHHHRAMITNKARWLDIYAMSLINGEHRRFAERSVAEHPAPTEKEIAEAEAAVGRQRLPTDGLSFFKIPWMPLAIFGTTLVMYVGVPALVAALLFRGGLVLLVAGVTFVRKDGARASRLRVFWRGLAAWGSLGLAAFVGWVCMCAMGGIPNLHPPARAFGWVWAAGSLFVIGALTIISIILPRRGLQDRLAGTWPVPR